MHFRQHLAKNSAVRKYEATDGVNLKMTAGPKTCSLSIYEVNPTPPPGEPEVFHIGMEENWIFYITFQTRKTLNLYSESAEIFVEFKFDADIPLKILWKVRDYLISDSYIKIEPLEDIILNQYADRINNLNYNISLDYNISELQSVYYFHKWINRTLIKGIKRSIETLQN